MTFSLQFQEFSRNCPQGMEHFLPEFPTFFVSVQCPDVIGLNFCTSLESQIFLVFLSRIFPPVLCLGQLTKLAFYMSFCEKKSWKNISCGGGELTQLFLVFTQCRRCGSKKKQTKQSGKHHFSPKKASKKRASLSMAKYWRFIFRVCPFCFRVKSSKSYLHHSRGNQWIFGHKIFLEMYL